MPRATRKKREDLNNAYAYVASTKFDAAARALKEGLVQSGFERQEVSDLVVDSNLPFPESKPTGVIVEPVEPIEIVLPAPMKDALPVSVIDAVRWDQQKHVLRIEKALSPEQTVHLANSLVDERNKAALIEALGMRSHVLLKEKASAELGKVFEIPVLALKQGKFSHQFEADDLSDYVEWSLSEAEANLTGFTIPDEKRGIKIDITDTEKLKQEFLSAGDSQLELLQSSKEWTVGELISWIDKSFTHVEVTQAEMGVYLSRVIGKLLDNGIFNLATLTAHRHRLSKAVEARVKSLGREEKRKALEEFLFKNDSSVFVDSAAAHLFSPYKYPYSYAYQGWDLPRHYYPVIGNLSSKGEEYDCARIIAHNKGIEFWIRNLSREPDASFWIQTSTDKFYPDFVCRLKNGKNLVIEYKAERYGDKEDTDEKERVGQLWAERSNGKCLFLMIKGKNDLGKIQETVEKSLAEDYTLR